MTGNTPEPKNANPSNGNMNNKRQRSSPGVSGGKSRGQKFTKLDYWLNPTKENNQTQNRFAILSDDESEVEEVNAKPEEIKPPPLFITGVKDIKPLNLLLEEIANNGYSIKLVNQEEVKIQASSMEVYDLISVELKNRNTEFFSYRKKQDRPFRVVLKNIHCSISLDTLKQQIEELGHSVVHISNIRNRITKSPLPMFFIDIKLAANNKDIYKVESLCNCKIKFEPPNKKREIPQCQRCQRYGHTKNFCSLQSRCVKCASTHSTASCPIKERSQHVKCVLCEGNHPANYKGCIVYKNLIKAKFPALRPKVLPVSQQTQVSAPAPSSSDMTYAQALRSSNTNAPEQASAGMQPDPINQSQNDIQELKEMMKTLIQQMSTMLNVLTTLVSKISNV